MFSLGYSVKTNISNIFDGINTAYIYLWLSKNWRVVYVGQTNDVKGTLGRACGHVATDGSLRRNFENEIGIPLEQADDLLLISYSLPKSPEYLSLETSYREAVEYLVQVKLFQIRGNLSPPFRLISKVRPNDRVTEISINEYANAIVEDFQQSYSFF